MNVQRAQVWVYASAGVMILGAFGPWIKALGTSVSGTDGSNDGWFVAGAAVLGAALFYLARDETSGAVWPFLAGLAGLGITLYDRHNIQDRIHSGGVLLQAAASIGWGLNLAIIGSASLTVAAAVAQNQLRSRTTARAQIPAVPTPPSD
jgi:hypothetical protein